MLYGKTYYTYITIITCSLIFGTNGCYQRTSEQLSSGLGIAVPMVIIRVFHMTNISHICCIHFEYSTPYFLIEGCAYTIM